MKTPFWEIGRGTFMPTIEHAALPMTLLDRFRGVDAESQLELCPRFLAPLSRPGKITLRDGR